MRQTNVKKRSEGKKSKLRSTVWIVIIAIVVIVGILGFIFLRKPAVPQKGKSGASTANGAIEQFVGAIAEADYQKALDSFDTEERVERFDLKLFIEQTQVFMPNQVPAPREEAYEVLNRAYFEGKAADQIKTFLFGLQTVRSGEQEISMSSEVFLGATGDAQPIIDVLKPENLVGVRVLSIDDANPTLQDAEINKGYTESLKKTYGCDNIREYTALIQMGEMYYKAGFTLAQYDTGWKIMSLLSPMSGITTEGMLIRTTEEVYRGELEAY